MLSIDTRYIPNHDKSSLDISSKLIYKLVLRQLLFSTLIALQEKVTNHAPVADADADADADPDLDVDCVGSASHSSASVVGLDAAVDGSVCIVVPVVVVVVKGSVVLPCEGDDVDSGIVNVTVVSLEVVDVTELADAVDIEVEADVGVETEAVDAVELIEVEEIGVVVLVAKVVVLVEVLTLDVVVRVVGVEFVVLDLVEVVDSTDDVVVVVAGLSGSSNIRIGPASNGTMEPTAEVLRSANL